jgi:hypothetical protein
MTIVRRGGRVTSKQNSDDAIGNRAVSPRPPLQRKSAINCEVSSCVTFFHSLYLLQFPNLDLDTRWCVIFVWLS